VGREEAYIVPLKDLEVGTHQYQYTLDDKFFEEVNGPLVQKGNIEANVTVQKSEHSFLLTFRLDGTVKVLCDRCLEEIDQPISCEECLTVKFGEDKSEEDDQLVVVSEEEGELDLSWYMYEFVALHIPIRHVHPDGECNEETARILREHLTVERNEAETEEEDGSAATNRGTDPRWDALKKLKDNN
jgi:Predicted metal-binding, possibly nucleic acid-binding protein